MSKKIKSKKKKAAVIPPKEQTSLPISGKGVSEVRIAALDEALDNLKTQDEALDALKEAVADAKKVAISIMHEHRDEMVQEANGGVSYAYDQRLWKLAPTGEKLTVKVIHDKNLGSPDE